MKVLIIGATGLLAKPVIHEFAANGFELRLFSRSIQQKDFPGNFEIVQGDVFNPEKLAEAVSGCDAIHITLGKTDEFAATQAIIDVAKQNNIGLISYISGCTVAKENCWFSMIEQKYNTEQAIMASGIPYLIFRPTWFMESLTLMVREGKATVIGKQPNPYHWLAAEDFAKMIVYAYKNPSTYNNAFYTYGPEKMNMHSALQQYCNAMHPGVKVSHTPITFLKFVARMQKNQILAFVCDMFAYFEKVSEPEFAESELDTLPQSQLTLQKWLVKVKAAQ